MVEEQDDSPPLIPPGLAAEIAARTQSWRMDASEMEKWLEDQLMSQLQINAMIANGTLPVPGRSGMTVMARALRDFGKQAELVLAALRKKE